MFHYLDGRMIFGFVGMICGVWLLFWLGGVVWPIDLAHPSWWTFPELLTLIGAFFAVIGMFGWMGFKLERPE